MGRSTFLAGDGAPAALVAIGVAFVSRLWEEVDRSDGWQRGVFFSLCAAYSIVSILSLVHLIITRPKLQGMEIHDVFYLLNFIVNGLRAVLFGLYYNVFLIRPKALEMTLVDLPGLLFFSTYTLLIMFWAEVYHKARDHSTSRVRPVYYIVNGVVYLIQVGIWVYVLLNPGSTSVEVAKLFLAVISLLAALGFLAYGTRLFALMRDFTVESKSRVKKMKQVIYLTAICFLCFLIRCIMVAVSAFSKKADLYDLGHPLLNLIYYTLAEIIPSALAIYILWKVPRRRASRGYRPVN